MQFVSVRILSLHLLVFSIFLICLNGANADDDNVAITTIKYSNDFENGEAVNVVPSGKNESTEYSFRIFDDDSDFPDDWEEGEGSISKGASIETEGSCCCCKSCSEVEGGLNLRLGISCWCDMI